jgi:hypothetical protein
MKHGLTGVMGNLPRRVEECLEIIAARDQEEDLTVSTSDIDLTAGYILGGSSGELRANYAALSVVNNASTGGLLYYKVAGDTTVRHTYLNPGQEFSFGPACTTIRSTSNSTTTTDIKIIYKDKAIFNGKNQN